MINVAVMGYGTVGSGVVEVLRTNGELINESTFWISEIFQVIR